MATAAAAVVAKARRDVISHFMQARAVDAASASRWVPDRRVQRRMLARLVRQGVLIETAADAYFLDLPAYDDWKRTLRRRIALLTGSAALIAALAGIFA
ncbi:hypothetical protein OMW55_10530 [Sphingomonas sp. BN140010]|uniref:Uncharacterized protein n=1 Tax=Sphingomonas arvum TaxID=2992113 RepID=A0ABT3JHI4_9SPHN|nr:hypothetical protein [Sphingomonas sp. BN140010]MCW3798236.1 hypothetical protein [Sphingomonas sp. BN140010]